MLRALGYRSIERFHMNEGHSSLLTLELLDESAREAGRAAVTYDDVERVRRKCVFTTHTTVAAGHDQFPVDLVMRVLGRLEIYHMKDVFCCGDYLNLTFLALNLSHYVNGVAKRYREISQQMFSGYSDGWWIEGCIEGATGWCVGENIRLTRGNGDPSKDAPLSLREVRGCSHPHVLQRSHPFH